MCRIITVICGWARVAGGGGGGDDAAILLQLSILLLIRLLQLLWIWFSSSAAAEDELHGAAGREALEARLIVSRDSSAWCPVSVVEVPEFGVHLAAERTWWLHWSIENLLRRHISLWNCSLTRSWRRLWFSGLYNRRHHSQTLTLILTLTLTLAAGGQWEI